ncbi:hypothetical protein [Sphingobacterium sp. JUb56]|uniref:TlpA family protein disulfide reductase n=1 Tax=Sphingobacterium sp. JUb56 TaxID=2587145 RepID=UPI001617C7F0|nr:hypothetical protein [Sphingobacterium sp. JUb56]MBB2950180.1 thiol-disulfide isomerase/thioredoxin [Sphingobacterium sp. JUb56]
MKNLTTLLYILCYLPFLVSGQLKSLRIGDHFSYTQPLQVINSPVRSIDVTSLGKELLILDFFTSSCGSCIEAMPKNNKLQTIFNSKIQILPVGIESRERITKLVSHNSYMKNLQFPLVVEDTALTKIFPHQGVPHVVWIYKGKVAAITTGDMVTAENIEQILTGQSVSEWPMKDDFYYEEQTVSHRVDSGFYSKLLPYINGAALNYAVDTIGDHVRVKMTNVTTVPAFLYLFGQLEQLPLMKKERIILQNVDVNDFENLDSIPESLWMQKHAFGYETTWSLKLEHKKRMEAIINDLSNRLNLSVELKYEKSSIWVVRALQANLPLVSNIKKKTSLRNWITMLEIFNTAFPPIELENVSDIEINTETVTDFDSLKLVLNKNGFDLQRVDKPILSLVVRSK